MYNGAMNMAGGTGRYTEQAFRKQMAEIIVEAWELIGATMQQRTQQFGPVATDPSSALTSWIIVGVMPDDPMALIDDVYRAKAKHYHPDNKTSGSEERFKMLSRAYEEIKRLKGA